MAPILIGNFLDNDESSRRINLHQLHHKWITREDEGFHQEDSVASHVLHGPHSFQIETFQYILLHPKKFEEIKKIKVAHFENYTRNHILSQKYSYLI